MVDLIGMGPGHDYSGNAPSDVPVQADLFLLFNGGFNSGSGGTVDIYRTGGTSPVEEVQLFDNPDVTFSDVGSLFSQSANATYTEVQIPLKTVLDPGAGYYVKISPFDAYPYRRGGSADSPSAHYQGLASPSAFTFTTKPSRPLLTGLGGAGYLQGGSPVLLAPGAAFTDADFNAGTVTVSGLGAGEQVTLSGSAGGLTFADSTILKNGVQVGTYGQQGGTFTATLTSGTAADIRTVVRSLSYADAAGGPAQSHNVTLTVTDQFGRSTVDSSKVGFTSQTLASPPASSLGVPIALADLNGDGTQDVVSGYGTTRYVDDNTGTGTAPSFAANPRPFAVGYYPGSIPYPIAPPFAFADVNGDGLPDLVSYDQSGLCDVFLNRTPPTVGSGAGSPRRPTPLFNYARPISFEDEDGFGTQAPAATSIALGDLNGDGLPDFVGATATGLVFFSNAGSTNSTGFQSSSEDPFQGAIDAVAGPNATVALGDINGDGTPDLVVGKADGSILAFLDTGTVTGSNGVKAPVFSTTPITIKTKDVVPPTDAPAVAVADLNGDGLADVVYRENGTYSYLKNTTAPGQALAVTVTPQPAAPTLDPGSDTGASNRDAITADAMPVVTGTAQPGAAVQLYVDGNAVGDPVTADKSTGAYSVTASGLTEGSNSLTVTQGIGGTTSTMSSALTVTLDTTAPTASSVTRTVAQGSGPTPIGIAAPSDNLSAAGDLAIAAGALPGDGRVTLGDGTPVVSGQALTAQQLGGLLFTPTPGLYSQGSTFTYTVTDTAGNGNTGTAALNIGGPGAPTITGTHGTTDLAEAPVQPFAGVTVTDPSSAAGATETLTIALTGGGGKLTDGAGYAGLRRNSDGSYTLTGTAAAVTDELDALSFTPTAGAPGTTSTTTFVLTDQSAAGTSVTDSGTSVADTAAQAPTSTNPPAPGSAPPDTVALSPQVGYVDGVFTLTGTASSAAGVKSVEISAVLNNGARKDLGAATVNQDGTFTFSDLIGPNSQSFFVATETDGNGVRTQSTGSYALAGGIGARGRVGQQTLYSPDGNTERAVANYSAYGQRFLNLQAPGQTVALRPFDVVAGHHQGGTRFVYTPDGAVGATDVIGGFKLGGADHDTLALPSSDFRNFAAVLRHTTYDGGGATITDPNTGDSILLRGVTEAALKAHPKDFSFV